MLVDSGFGLLRTGQWLPWGPWKKIKMMRGMKLGMCVSLCACVCLIVSVSHCAFLSLWQDYTLKRRLVTNQMQFKLHKLSASSSFVPAWFGDWCNWEGDWRRDSSSKGMWGWQRDVGLWGWQSSWRGCGSYCNPTVEAFTYCLECVTEVTWTSQIQRPGRAHQGHSEPYTRRYFSLGPVSKGIVAFQRRRWRCVWCHLKVYMVHLKELGGRA